MDGAMTSERPGGPDLLAFVRSEGALSRVELLVKGARCAACIRKIEGGLLAAPGVADARLNLSTGRLGIAWRGPPDHARALQRLVQDMGFEAALSLFVIPKLRSRQAVVPRVRRWRWRRRYPERR